MLIKETNDFDDINNFFVNNYWNRIENFVKIMRKVSSCTFLSSCLLTPPSEYALTASIFDPSFTVNEFRHAPIPCLMRETIRFFSPITVKMLRQIQVVSHRTNVCFFQEVLGLLHLHPELLIIFLPSIHPIHNQVGVTHNLHSYLVSPAWIPNPQFIPLLHYLLLPPLFLLTFLILFINFGPVFCHLVLFSC